MNLVVRRTEVEHAVGFQRRRFKGVLGCIITLTQIAGVIGPGHFQIFNVIFSDLLQCREALAICGPAIGVPLFSSTAGRGTVTLGIDGALLRQRIVEAEANHQQHHQHHGAAKERMEATLSLIERTNHPRQSQPDTQHTKQVAARDPLPLIEAHFPDRPEQRYPHQQRIQRQYTAFVHHQQNRAEQNAYPHQRIERAASCKQKLSSHVNQGDSKYHHDYTGYFIYHDPSSGH